MRKAPLGGEALKMIVCCPVGVDDRDCNKR